MPWDLSCPACRTPFERLDADEQRCPRCAVNYRREEGIWRLFAEGRREAMQGFISRYEAVRTGEGRTVVSRRHLRSLPFRDLSRKRPYEWSIRARSFRSLLRHVVRPFERTQRRSLRILDLGSGVGWLAHRLMLRGHDVAAVDLVANDFDGLGVQRLYDRPALLVQAEFDRLPLADRSADLVVYNASVHYAADYAATLREGLRVLRAGGQVVMMDSPLYRDTASGVAMVQERERRLRGSHVGAGAEFGFEPEGFLTYERLDRLEGELGIAWEFVAPWYGVRWWLRPWVARLRGTRAPAQFKLVIGHRAGD